MNPQIILSICQLVSVTVIPIIVWIGGAKFQDRKAKKDAKRKLFFTLMANRKTSTIRREKVDALNLIDVVFQDDKKVRQAWKDYMNSLNSLSPDFPNNNAFALDLLSEMALSLGYKEMKQTEIDRFYEPVQFTQEQELQGRLDNEKLRVLMASKSFSDSFSKEELEERSQENQSE
jgi:hypothetical protein